MRNEEEEEGRKMVLVLSSFFLSFSFYRRARAIRRSVSVVGLTGKEVFERRKGQHPLSSPTGQRWYAVIRTSNNQRRTHTHRPILILFLCVHLFCIVSISILFDCFFFFGLSQVPIVRLRLKNESHDEVRLSWTIGPLDGARRKDRIENSDAI